MLKTKKYLLLMVGVMLCDQAYSQSPMRLPNSVGVYSANGASASQMRLPSQVGAYQAPNQGNVRYANPYTVNPYRQKTVVDYSQNPVMGQGLYENLNGYQTPNRYVLQSPSVQAKAREMAQGTKLSEEFGTEYYLLLGYGSGSFTGNGLTNSEIDPPMNNISDGLGKKPKLLNIGFGVMQDRNIRVDVSYTNISGLHYDSTSYTEEQLCEPTFENIGDDGNFIFDCADESEVTGGAISSNALMLNVQVPLTDLFGDVFKETLGWTVVPYIGAGVGMAFNTISDYTVFDEYGDAEAPLDASGDVYDPDTDEDLNGFYDYDGTLTHFGAMTNSVAWTVEAGVSIYLDKKTMLDIYYKMGKYGAVKTKDVVYHSYERVDIVDPTDTENSSTDGSYSDFCSTQALDEGYSYNADMDWCESEPYTVEGYTSGLMEQGKIETTEVGVKLRFLF